MAILQYPLAESSLPEFADPIAIGKPDFAADDDKEIRIVAVAVRAHMQLFGLKKRAAA